MVKLRCKLKFQGTMKVVETLEKVEMVTLIKLKTLKSVWAMKWRRRA